MTKNKRSFYLLILFLTIFSLRSFGYAVGDFVTVGSGLWNVSTTWNTVSVVSPLTLAATGLFPTTTNNAFVRTGHTVTLPTTGPYSCKNLTVEPGAKLWTSGSATDIYLWVYGTSLQCDGTIGNGATFDGISFGFEGATCAITGAGAFDASRIRKNSTTVPAVTNTTLTISMNVNLRFNGNGADIYNGTKGAESPSNFNVTVSSGVTLNLLGGASIDSIAGNGVKDLGGTFTINGRMLIAGRLYLTTNNANSTYKCNWIVNGYLKVDRMISTTSGAAGHSFTVNSGDTLDIAGDSAWINPMTNALTNTYTFASGSYVLYSSSAPTGLQTIRVNSATELGATGTYGNLVLSGTSVKKTTGNLIVKNSLTILNSAVLVPFAAGTQISVGGNWSNYNETGYTESGTTVKFNGSSAQSITCPGGELFYNLTYQQSSAVSRNVLTFHSPVDVINQLSLSSDSEAIDLNSNTLTIRDSLTSSINNNGGDPTTRSIISEKTDNSSKIKWKINTTPSANLVYVFPFGKTDAEYIPDTMTVSAAGTNMGYVTISTYGTPSSNSPLPTSPVTVTNLTAESTGPPSNDSDATVDRFWQIDATGGGAADIAFTYAPSELPVAPYNFPAQMGAQWYNGSTNAWQLPVLGTANGYTITVPSNTHYGPWTLVNIISPLPIKLLEFTAKLYEHVVDVNWISESEVNNDFFTVERSKNGNIFEDVGIVKGSGTTSELHSYGLVDPKPLEGLSYYRLRQTDFDGHFTYSNMVPVFYKDGNSDFYVFPNPATDQVNIVTGSNFSNENTILQIFDVRGTLISTAQINMNNQSITTININNLSTGIYIGKISDDYNQQVFKIIRN